MTSTDSPKRGRRPGTWVIIACAVCAVAGGVIGGVIGSAIDSPSSAPAAAASSTVTGQSGSDSQPAGAVCPVTEVAKEVLPSVVTITATGASAGGTGSGEVIRSDGYILTNNHVIAPAANGGTLKVLFSDGKTAAATITGRDPRTDVAVIKADESGLPAISVGKSSTLQVGQPVVALGAPLGLSSTVTSGIVSALDRTVEVPAGNSQTALLLGAIQTDAAINPGNSGGALVNCAGQFVGIPSAGASVPSSSGEPSGGNIGLGFAIPSDLAIAQADEIIATGRVSHAYLGISAAPATGATAASSGAVTGLYVTVVDPTGPAHAAGLRVGDIITTIDGAPATGSGQLIALTLSKNPGGKVQLGYERDGAKATTTVTLGTQP
jgi:putative serine protease PepD